MKSSHKGLLLSLVCTVMLGIVGCEDNEQSSGIMKGGTTNEGADKVKPMSPEEYAKKNAGGATPKGGYGKAATKTGTAPK